MNSYRRAVIASFFVLSPLCVCGAQTPDTMATVRGIAVDSVNGGYLKGALISVSGTIRSATTDSLGRFTIDSIPPGSRILELQHPLLDTLGVSVVTPRLEFTRGADLSAVVSSPSPDKVIALKCSTADRSKGLGALLGSVTDPDDFTPVANASVTLDWTDVEISGKDLKRTLRHASAKTTNDGSFRICGLPEDFTAILQASLGVDSTASVGVVFAPRLAIASLTLGHSVVAATQAGGVNPESPQRLGATLRGRVVNAKGTGIPNARVSVDDRDPAAITGSDGSFVLTALPSGTRLLSVRRIGFEPVEQVVRLSSVRESSAIVVLNNPVQTLETVRVTALSRVGLSTRGFYDRQKNSKGTFFDPDFLARRNPFHLDEVLRSLPFVREVPNPRIHGTTTIEVRDPKWECLEYVVDGRPWMVQPPTQQHFARLRDSTMAGGTDRGSPNQWIRGNEVAAMEAYPPGQAPPEIQSMATQSGVCTTIVIWTKWKIGAN